MKLKPYKDAAGGTGYTYLCPCGDYHAPSSGWQFNGDMEKPTFSPSVLVTTGHYVGGKPAVNCWCDYKQRTGEDAPFNCYLCHSFVRDGMVQFLSDCTHALAGQTVPLGDLPRSEQ